jgi:hypothetical protein
MNEQAGQPEPGASGVGGPSPTVFGAVGVRRQSRRLRDRIRQGDSYGIVLVFVVATVGLLMWSGDSLLLRLLALVAAAATLEATLRTSFVPPRLVRALMLATLPLTAVALVTTALTADRLSEGIAAVFTAMLAFVAPVAILRRLTRQMEISLETVMGAVCVYLLFGLLFSQVFALSGAVVGGFFDGVADPTPADYIFFSYVTLATVGYGNLIPARTGGQTLAILEMLSGQLYLVTVIALIVGNLGRRRESGDEKGEASPSA